MNTLQPQSGIARKDLQPVNNNDVSAKPSAIKFIINSVINFLNIFVGITGRTIETFTTDADSMEGNKYLFSNLSKSLRCYRNDTKKSLIKHDSNGKKNFAFDIKKQGGSVTKKSIQDFILSRFNQSISLWLDSKNKPVINFQIPTKTEYDTNNSSDIDYNKFIETVFEFSNQLICLFNKSNKVKEGVRINIILAHESAPSGTNTALNAINNNAKTNIELLKESATKFIADFDLSKLAKPRQQATLQLAQSTPSPKAAQRVATARTQSRTNRILLPVNKDLSNEQFTKQITEQNNLGKSILVAKGAYVAFGNLLDSKSYQRSSSVTAIVNAANSSLSHGAGIAWGIVNADGQEFQTDSRSYIQKNGQLKIGQCNIQSTHKLKQTGIDYVINTVAPHLKQGEYQSMNTQQQKEVFQQLKSAYYGFMKTAQENGITEISTPFLGVGIFHNPPSVSMQAFQYAVKDFRNNYPKYALDVNLILQPIADATNQKAAHDLAKTVATEILKTHKKAPTQATTQTGITTIHTATRQQDNGNPRDLYEKSIAKIAQKVLDSTNNGDDIEIHSQIQVVYDDIKNITTKGRKTVFVNAQKEKGDLNDISKMSDIAVSQLGEDQVFMTESFDLKNVGYEQIAHFKQFKYTKESEDEIFDYLNKALCSAIQQAIKNDCKDIVIPLIQEFPAEMTIDAIQKAANMVKGDYKIKIAVSKGNTDKKLAEVIAKKMIVLKLRQGDHSMLDGINTSIFSRDVSDNDREILSAVHHELNISPKDLALNTEVSRYGALRGKLTTPSQYGKKNHPVKETYRNIHPINQTTSSLTIKKNRLGVIEEMRKHATNNPQDTVGFGVAGNSGQLLGGLVQSSDIKDLTSITRDGLTGKKGGQEETVMREVLHNLTAPQYGDTLTTFKDRKPIQGHDGDVPDKQINDMNNILYSLAYYKINDERMPLKGLFADRNSTQTASGVDFTKTKREADYGGSFTITNLPLKPLTANQQQEITTDSKTLTYPRAHAVFTDGPCTKGSKTNSSAFRSMSRTKNERAKNNEDFRINTITDSLRESIDSAVRNGCNVFFPAQIGCGIYAPNTEARNKLKPNGSLQDGEYMDILEEILDETVGPNGEKRGQYLKEVIVVDV